MRLIDIEPFEKEGWHLQRYDAGIYGASTEIKELSKLPTVGGWISVKDRLPEQYGNYLAVVDGEVMECTYSRPFIKGIISGWSTCYANGFKWLRDGNVTHWMQLPEPPKEET